MYVYILAYIHIYVRICILYKYTMYVIYVSYIRVMYGYTCIYITYASDSRHKARTYTYMSHIYDTYTYTYMSHLYNTYTHQIPGTRHGQFQPPECGQGIFSKWNMYIECVLTW